MGISRGLDTSLRTLVAVVVLPAALVTYSIRAVALALLGRPPARVHSCYVGFARVCLWFGGTSLHVHGAEHALPGRAYVVASNHASAWDPVCIVAAIPHVRLRFVVKRAIMRIPIFGVALRRTGNLTVVRSDTSRDVQSLQEGMAGRAPEVSMLFFAEGTRSRDGRLHELKMGAFATAIAQGLPVLPVAVAGTFEIWPKGTLRLRRGAVVVEVGDPIAVHGRSLDERAALRDDAYRVLVALHERAHERLAALRDGAGNVGSDRPR